MRWLILAILIFLSSCVKPLGPVSPTPDPCSWARKIAVSAKTLDLWTAVLADPLMPDPVKNEVREDVRQIVTHDRLYDQYCTTGPGPTPAHP